MNTVGQARWVRAVQRNRLFRFLSSVRMAVPLMLVILVAVAAGTLYEARYNADVAGLRVYRTFWFQGLLSLLWVNVFCAAASRIPWKKHHIGFVTTHVGLLTLLIGAWITAHYGIDGQLTVVEGQSSATVMLPNLVVRVSGGGAGAQAASYAFRRSLEVQGSGQLRFDELARRTGLSVQRYLPFVAPPSSAMEGRRALASGEGGAALGFTLQSAYFNVNEQLALPDKPETQMGPARIRLIAEAGPAQGDEPGVADGVGGTLIVKDAAKGAVLARIPVAELEAAGGKSVRGVRIELIRAYGDGIVAQGKLAEGGEPGKNPALELRLKSGAKSVREISFASYPDFSLDAASALGIRLVYEAGRGDAPPTSGAASEEALPAGHPRIPMHGEERAQSAPAASAADRGGNVIEFHALAADPGHVRLELYKNGESVLKKRVALNEPVQTPWMGMKITVTSLSVSGGSPAAAPGPDGEEVEQIDLQPKTPLPPSAIYVGGEGTQGGWIVEGESRVFQTRAGQFEVYFGPDSVELPFSIALMKFKRTDYPGTDTAMGFQSTVKVDGSGPPIEIKMNEPLQHQGFTLYQASYQMAPGQPTASIFSVNRDPGRGIKYLGALILTAGIAIFTLMRSRWYRRLETRKVVTA